MKTDNTLKFNDYEYDELESDYEFLLGELKDEEIRQKVITPKEVEINETNINLLEKYNSPSEYMIHRFCGVAS